MITIPLDDPQSNSKDAKKNDKYNAGSIASLSQENQIDNISGDVSQKELVQRLYDGMYNLGVKKVRDRQADLCASSVFRTVIWIPDDVCRYFADDGIKHFSGDDGFPEGNRESEKICGDFGDFSRRSP